MNLMYKTTQGRNSTAEELCEEMRVTWRMSGNDDESKNTKSEEHELETALGTLKGKCNKCHVVGHTAVDCLKKKDMTQVIASEKAGAVRDNKNQKESDGA